LKTFQPVHVILNAPGGFVMKKLVLLLCVVLMLIQGCATNTRGLETSPAFAGAHDHGFDAERTPVSHGDALVAIYIAVAAVIVVAFIVDLVLIPVAASHHCHYFPCCSALIHCCH
jgi:hypothetical protein